jgi:hypothetical protein
MQPLMRPSLRTDGAARFFDYWNSLPKADLVPDRRAFSPTAIPDLMRAVTILEIWSRDRIEIRLAGTGVCDVMGFDPTGFNMLDLQRAPVRVRYLELVEEQVKRPCGRRSVLNARQADGTILRVETISLPMRHVLTGHDMLLSYFNAIETIGFGESSYQILAYEDTEWIDVGAGTPDWS